MSKSTFHTSWIDYSLEPSNNKLTIAQITAGNLVATLALVDTLTSAMAGITKGQLHLSKVSARDVVINPNKPTDPTAQRESKWLARYHDTVTGKKYRTEIPTADITGTRLQANSDMADLTEVHNAAFKTAFEAVVTDPDTGLNPVVLDTMEFVGKRL